MGQTAGQTTAGRPPGRLRLSEQRSRRALHAAQPGAAHQGERHQQNHVPAPTRVRPPTEGRAPLSGSEASRCQLRFQVPLLMMRKEVREPDCGRTAEAATTSITAGTPGGFVLQLSRELWAPGGQETPEPTPGGSCLLPPELCSTAASRTPSRSEARGCPASKCGSPTVSS